MTDDRAWRQAMQRLGSEAALPPALEARVRRSLRRRHRGVLAAAALLLLAAGGFLGRVTAAGPQPAPGPHFLLLLYENERFNPGGVPHDRLVREYSAWAGSLAERKLLVTASELQAEETLLGGTAGSTRGPAGLIDGFFVVRAASLAEAEALAATSPHLKYGGAVAVRPLAGRTSR